MKKNTKDWLLASNGFFYDFNYFDYTSQVKVERRKFPSSIIFNSAYEKLNLNFDVEKMIYSLMKHNRKNKTIFGIRKEKDFYSAEFYFFYPKAFKENNFNAVLKIAGDYDFKIDFSKIKEPNNYYLTSINLRENSVQSIEYYHNLVDYEKDFYSFGDLFFEFNKDNPVFYSNEINFITASTSPKNIYYTYYNLKQLPSILKKLLELSNQLFKTNAQNCLDFLGLDYIYINDILLHPVSIKIKSNNTIGMYYSNIGFENFIEFLSKNNYESSFIDDIREKKYFLNHLKFDIGFDFLIENGNFQIVKSAFFGSI